jgi:hypothetical protein
MSLGRFPKFFKNHCVLLLIVKFPLFLPKPGAEHDHTKTGLPFREGVVVLIAEEVGHD